MRTIEMKIRLTYNDDAMHKGDNDQKAKNWFFTDILQRDYLEMYSHQIGDFIGDIDVLQIWQEAATAEGGE